MAPAQTSPVDISGTDIELTAFEAWTPRIEPANRSTHRAP
jgi:hypothetical protein